MQKGIHVKKPDVRNVRMSEVRNGEGKKEIMEAVLKGVQVHNPMGNVIKYGVKNSV